MDNRLKILLTCYILVNVEARSVEIIGEDDGYISTTISSFDIEDETKETTIDTPFFMDEEIKGEASTVIDHGDGTVGDGGYVNLGLAENDIHDNEPTGQGNVHEQNVIAPHLEEVPPLTEAHTEPIKTLVSKLGEKFAPFLGKSEIKPKFHTNVKPFVDAGRPEIKREEHKPIVMDHPPPLEIEDRQGKLAMEQGGLLGGHGALLHVIRDVKKDFAEPVKPVKEEEEKVGLESPIDKLIGDKALGTVGKFFGSNGGRWGLYFGNVIAHALGTLVKGTQMALTAALHGGVV